MENKEFRMFVVHYYDERHNEEGYYGVHRSKVLSFEELKKENRFLALRFELDPEIKSCEGWCGSRYYLIEKLADPKSEDPTKLFEGIDFNV